MAKSSKKKGKGNKFLLGLGIVVLLIALFFASFWVTTLSLRSNSEPDAITESTDTPTATATASPEVNYKKMSKKELIKIIEQKEDRIKELEEALGLNGIPTQAPIDELGSSSESSAAPTAKPSTAPAEKTAEPTKTSAPKPTAATKPTATQKPAAPKPVATPKPVVTSAPAPKPTQAPAPATKAPSIKPMAPAADSE